VQQYQVMPNSCDNSTTPSKDLIETQDNCIRTCNNADNCTAIEIYKDRCRVFTISEEDSLVFGTVDGTTHLRKTKTSSGICEGKYIRWNVTRNAKIKEGIHSQILRTTKKVLYACFEDCLARKDCVSVSYNQNKGRCFLFNETLAQTDETEKSYPDGKDQYEYTCVDHPFGSTLPTTAQTQPKTTEPTTTTTSTTITIESATSTTEPTTPTDPTTIVTEDTSTTTEHATTKAESTTIPTEPTTTPTESTIVTEHTFTTTEYATTTREPTTTPTELSTTTTDSATTLSEQTTATTELTTTTMEPATTMMEPATTTIEHATTTAEPTTATREPTTKTTELTATITEPATTTGTTTTTTSRTTPISSTTPRTTISITSTTPTTNNTTPILTTITTTDSVKSATKSTVTNTTPMIIPTTTTVDSNQTPINPHETSPIMDKKILEADTGFSVDISNRKIVTTKKDIGTTVNLENSVGFVKIPPLRGQWGIGQTPVIATAATNCSTGSCNGADLPVIALAIFNPNGDQMVELEDDFTNEDEGFEISLNILKHKVFSEMQRGTVLEPNSRAVYSFPITTRTNAWFIGFNINQELSFHIRMKTGAQPTSDNFEKEVVLGASSRVKREVLDKADVTNNTLVVTSNGEQSGGSMYVTIEANGWNKTNLNSTMYDFGILAIEPIQWDARENTWVAATSKVSNTSTKKNILFRSKFFGSFSAKLFVPPNTIDFISVFSDFDTRLADSYTVLVTIIILIVFYIILMILARRLDKRENDSRQYRQLADNDSNDQFKYTIHVFTGSKYKAGTDANCFFQLYGDMADSGPRKLTDGKVAALRSGCLDNFVFTTDRQLGDILYIRVWHDNSGRDNHWYLERIVIQSIFTEQCQVFECNKWLSLKKGDGQIDRLLAETGNDNSYSEKLNKQARNAVMERHLVMSLLRKPGSSRFTRTQRLSVCMCMLCLMMISSAMWYNTEEQSGTHIHLFSMGPIDVSWHEFYTSFLTIATVYPITLCISELFRRTKQSHRCTMSELLSTQREDMKHKPKAQLPRWVLLPAWCLVACCIVAPCFFTFLYSLEWGSEKSGKWLGSFAISFLEAIVILDPIVLLLIAIFMSCLFKFPNDMHDIEAPTSEEQITPSDQHRQNIGLRAPDPPTENDLKERRSEYKKDDRLAKAVKEIATYIFYIMLLLVICDDNRTNNEFYQSESIRELIKLSSKTKIQKLRRFDDIWQWLENDALLNLYPLTTYNGDYLTGMSLDSLGSIIHMDGVRLGPSRLRQIRTKQGECQIPFESNKIGVDHCKPDYTQYTEDVQDYSTSWRKKHEENDGFVSTKRQRPFLYQTSSETENMIHFGELTNYGGGGYIANLGISRQEVTSYLRKLKYDNWLDSKTRALFFELTLYNANTNLFTNVKVVFEIPATGGFILSDEIISYRLYNYVGPKSLIIVTAQIIWLIVLITLTIKTGKEIWRQNKKYFMEFWNIIELLNISSAFAAWVSFGFKSFYAVKAVEKLRNNKGEFVMFEEAKIWNETFVSILAINVFIGIVKFAKLLKFNRHISIVFATLRIARSNITSFVITILLIYMAFASAATGVFTTEKSFASIITTFESLFTMGLGHSKFNSLFTESTLLNRLFFAVFTTFTLYVVFNMLMAIIIDAFNEVREDESSYSYDKELVEHIMKKFAVFVRSFMTSYNLQRTEPESKEEPTIHSKVTKGDKSLMAAEKFDDNKVIEKVDDLMNRLYLVMKTEYQ
ncbi:unnamed protein product, partial [Owenia fusiformis]